MNFNCKAAADPAFVAAHLDKNPSVGLHAGTEHIESRVGRKRGELWGRNNPRPRKVR
jgi:hypothetical protein